MVVEPENKLVFLTTAAYVSAFESKQYREGRMSFKILDEQLRTEFIVFPIEEFSPFFEEFKITIQLLVELGFKPSYSNKNAEHFKNRHETLDDLVPPLVLTMEDLEIGFSICLVPLIMSLAALVVELALPKVKAFLSHAQDLLALWYWIQAVSKIVFGLH